MQNKLTYTKADTTIGINPMVTKPEFETYQYAVENTYVDKKQFNEQIKEIDKMIVGIGSELKQFQDATNDSLANLSANYVSNIKEISSCIHLLFENTKSDHDRIHKLESEVSGWKSICAVLFGAIITYLIFNYFFI